MKGTASHSRVMVGLDQVERGHISLDTVRAQAAVLRWGCDHTVNALGTARHQNSSQSGVSKPESIWGSSVCQLHHQMVLGAFGGAG